MHRVLSSALQSETFCGMVRALGDCSSLAFSAAVLSPACSLVHPESALMTLEPGRQ